ncbi:MAG: heparinase II/III family protein [Cytophagales bacterium]|nr:heparinase II/III family protein [Armatimonadota bacterium]
MKITRPQFLMLGPATFLSLALPEIGRADDPKAPRKDAALTKDPLKTLRAEHPRLIATDADLANTRRHLKTDPLAQQYRDNVYKAGEKLLSEPTIKYELVGPRLLEESRLCMRRMYTLGVLYRLDGDTKWSDRAKKELFAAAAFPDWNPSHFLDTAEMTHAFAIGYDWLYPALTVRERKIVRDALVEKGLRRGEEAYRGASVSWKWWITADHNWNQVCNGGMILGALAVADEEPELASFTVRAALQSLPRAMASFAPDGGWEEGPGYWSYTLNYTVALLAGLQSALGTDFGISNAAGFERTGAFRLFFVGTSGRPFSYADVGDGKAGGAPVMHWLARRFRQPLYAWEAKRGAGSGGGVQDLLWYEPTTATPKTTGLPLDIVFRGVEVAFLRSAWEDPGALWVGFKGGDNRANHSHLDLGTFVFDALGERWVSDIGSDNYNLPAYFGAKRWTYYRLRTEGQNTLLLDNGNQDTKAKSPLIAFSTRPDAAYAVADLSAAYAPSGATRTQRGVALVNGRTALLVQDEFAAKVPTEYRWQVHTQATITQITADGKGATLIQNGKTMTARILSPEGARFTNESAAPPPINGGEGSQQNPNKGITRLVVRLPGKVMEARVAVLLAPPADAFKPVSLTPLADWIRNAPPLPERGVSLPAKAAGV